MITKIKKCALCIVHYALWIAGLLVVTEEAAACTSVIVSGKVTPDGRPYIFKNRDTEDTDNLVVSVKGATYRYIAIVSARDSVPRGIWSGHNEAGFAIANTAAYNLNERSQRPASGSVLGRSKENDATIMRKALETCATLEDFEHLLDSLKALGPIPTNSNFAVLDARGGCAYYETGHKGYVKYDANDPAQAPYGYLIRTNHGLSGDRSMDKGVERYLAINEIMTRQAFSNEGFDFEYTIRRVTRHLTHGLTHLDLYDFLPEDDHRPVFFPFRDFIPRYQTASAHLIQGVGKGEDPLLTVSWIIPGSTLTTVGIPLWIVDKGELPSVVTRNKEGRASLVDAGFRLKRELFPIERGNGMDYINLARLINKSGTGILQQIQLIEDEIFRRAAETLGVIRKNGNARKCSTHDAQCTKEIRDYYRWVDQYLKDQYQQRFNIQL